MSHESSSLWKFEGFALILPGCLVEFAGGRLDGLSQRLGREDVPSSGRALLSDGISCPSADSEAVAPCRLLNAPSVEIPY